MDRTFAAQLIPSQEASAVSFPNDNKRVIRLQSGPTRSPIPAAMSAVSSRAALPRPGQTGQVLWDTPVLDRAVAFPAFSRAAPLPPRPSFRIRSNWGKSPTDITPGIGRSATEL